MTVTTTVRRRGRTSHSRWNTCCQVPNTGLPSATGTESDGPMSVACKCEWPLGKPKSDVLETIFWVIAPMVLAFTLIVVIATIVNWIMSEPKTLIQVIAEEWAMVVVLLHRLW